MNGNDPTQIKDGENNDANATYEANIGVPGVKDEGDAEETIGEDIDLSLLHEDDDEADSGLERSNDDTEAIKLLNEDDDAFEFEYLALFLKTFANALYFRAALHFTNTSLPSSTTV